MVHVEGSYAVVLIRKDDKLYWRAGATSTRVREGDGEGSVDQVRIDPEL